MAELADAGCEQSLYGWVCVNKRAYSVLMVKLTLKRTVQRNFSITGSNPVRRLLFLSPYDEIGYHNALLKHFSRSESWWGRSYVSIVK